MIFSAAVGAVLAFMKFETPMALLILTGCLSAKALVDVRWDRMPVVGTISPYAVYCRNLSLAGEPVDYAWISYALQLFVFGVLLGLMTYAFVGHFM